MTPPGRRWQAAALGDEFESQHQLGVEAADAAQLAAAQQRGALVLLAVHCGPCPPARCLVPADAGVRYLKREIARRTSHRVPVDAQELSATVQQGQGPRVLTDFDRNGREALLADFQILPPGPCTVHLKLVSPSSAFAQRLASAAIAAGALSPGGGAALRQLPLAALSSPVSPTAQRYVNMLPAPATGAASPAASLPALPEGRRQESAKRRQRAAGSSSRWTLEQTEDLVAGVEASGCGKWADIRDRYASLAAKSSVALKDRWRNLQHAVKHRGAGERGLKLPHALRTRILACLPEYARPVQDASALSPADS